MLIYPCLYYFRWIIKPVKYFNVLLNKKKGKISRIVKPVKTPGKILSLGYLDMVLISSPIPNTCIIGCLASLKCLVSGTWSKMSHALCSRPGAKRRVLEKVLMDIFLFLHLFCIVRKWFICFFTGHSLKEHRFKKCL